MGKLVIDTPVFNSSKPSVVSVSEAGNEDRLSWLKRPHYDGVVYE